jgi:hypothetical protein
MRIPKQRKQKVALEQFGLANIFEQSCKIQCRELRKGGLAYQQALAKQNRRSSLGLALRRRAQKPNRNLFAKIAISSPRLQLTQGHRFYGHTKAPARALWEPEWFGS